MLHGKLLGSEAMRAAGLHLPICSLPGFNKVHSILTNVSEELNDVPLYFNLHDM